MAGGADEHVVAVAGIHQDLGDVLGILQSDVGPVFAAVGGLVDAIADRDAVARPGFAGTDPDVLRIRGINRDRADGLHVGLDRRRLEGRAAVDRFPDAAAGRADEDGDACRLDHGVTAAMRPLMVAEPMLRAGSPEIVPESNFTAVLCRNGVSA